jgi:iron-sulfur cluster repair protein YtfE (RIC family)
VTGSDESSGLGVVKAWPRERWQEHPNWPQQTLLLGSHDGFRRLSSWLIESVAELDLTSDDPLRGRKRGILLRMLFDQWQAGMSSHEHYEESKLYPYLARKYGAEFEHLERGHRDLHEARDEVSVRFRKVAAVGAGHSARDQLGDTLESYNKVLVEHLRVEENLVIPLLLTLSPHEFREYSVHSLRDLTRRMDERGE